MVMVGFVVVVADTIVRRCGGGGGCGCDDKEDGGTTLNTTVLNDGVGFVSGNVVVAASIGTSFSSSTLSSSSITLEPLWWGIKLAVVVRVGYAPLQC